MPGMSAPPATTRPAPYPTAVAGAVLGAALVLAATAFTAVTWDCPTGPADIAVHGMLLGPVGVILADYDC